MKETVVDANKEYQELIGGLSQTVKEVSDPVAIGAMLFQIAHERKNTNLIIQQLNAKIDGLVNKINKIETEKTQAISAISSLSERDMEVLRYVEESGRVTAEQLQKKFKYSGKNGASARLSKLFHEGKLKKEYMGRKVIYTVK